LEVTAPWGLPFRRPSSHTRSPKYTQSQQKGKAKENDFEENTMPWKNFSASPDECKTPDYEINVLILLFHSLHHAIRRKETFDF